MLGEAQLASETASNFRRWPPYARVTGWLLVVLMTSDRRRLSSLAEDRETGCDPRRPAATRYG